MSVKQSEPLTYQKYLEGIANSSSDVAVKPNPREAMYEIGKCSPIPETEKNSTYLPFITVIFDASGSTRYQMNSASGARRVCVAPVPVPDCTVPEETSAKPKSTTKHISLACVEALGIVFQKLGHALAPNCCYAGLKIVQFSTTAKVVYESQTPVSMELLFELVRDLPNKLEFPEFGSTNLLSGLQNVEFNNQHNLLITVTDGQCDNSQVVIDYMTQKINAAETEGRIIDMFVIGAGSIGMTNGIVIPIPQSSCELVSFTIRCSSKSHVTGANPYYASSECNRAYLLSLMEMATILGRRAYAGAYGDYTDLENTFHKFILGKLETMKKVYVSNNQGGWWPAKEHQIQIATTAFLQESETNFDKNGFKVTIGVRTRNTTIPYNDGTVNADTVLVTDEYGTRRLYAITTARLA
jgi:hypothetical protein